ELTFFILPIRGPDFSPGRPVSSSCDSSEETLRTTLTTTTRTTRTFEKQRFTSSPNSISAPKNVVNILRRDSSLGRRQYPSNVALSASSTSSLASGGERTRTPKVVSFKDEEESSAVNTPYSSRLNLSSASSSIPEPLPKGISMEKYFDNLISMIRDAAEDLKV
ncbi:Uncharacterized protein FKW44_013231, partial [Caligus rogercresseyi]